MSLQSNTNNDIFIVPSQSLMQFSGSSGNTITLQVEPSGDVNFVGTTGSILKIMDNLSGSLFSVNNISGLSLLEVFSNNQIKLGNPTNYALVISGSNVIITGSLVDKSSGTKFLVVDSTTGVVYTTGSGGGGGGSPTSPGGSNTQIQYNNSTTFGGVPSLTYDGTTLRATGSFTGSFSGSLFGTASWADSASQAISSSYVKITSTNTGTLTVSYTTPGEIQLTAITSSNNAQGTSNELQYSAGSGTFGKVVSSSYNSGQLTLGNVIATGSFTGSLSGSLFGTASWASTASLAITASYVNIQAGPRIQAVNYNSSSGVTTITGSIGGSDTQIQFNSGSAFGGAANFNYNYTSNILNLTSSVFANKLAYHKFYGNGLINQIGSPEPKGFFANMSTAINNGGFVHAYFRDNNNIGYYPLGFNLFTNFRTGLPYSNQKDFDSHFVIRTYAIDPNRPPSGSLTGNVWATQSMADIAFGDLQNTFGDYYATSSLRESAFAVYGRSIPSVTGSNSYLSQYSYGPFSSSLAVWANGKTVIGLKQIPAGLVTDLPPRHNILETRGSIGIISRGDYTTGSAENHADTTAIYFGTPNVVGNWRIIQSGSGATSTLVVEKFIGSSYSKSATFI
jgi:hypothetical protein